MRTPERKALLIDLCLRRPLLLWGEIEPQINALPGAPMTLSDLRVWRCQLNLPRRDAQSRIVACKRTIPRRAKLRAMWQDDRVIFDDVLAAINAMPGTALSRVDLHLWRHSLGLPRRGENGEALPPRPYRERGGAVEFADSALDGERLGSVSAAPEEIMDWARRSKVARFHGWTDQEYLSAINQRRAKYGLPRFRPVLAARSATPSEKMTTT